MIRAIKYILDLQRKNTIYQRGLTEAWLMIHRLKEGKHHQQFAYGIREIDTLHNLIIDLFAARPEDKKEQNDGGDNSDGGFRDPVPTNNVLLWPYALFMLQFCNFQI